MWGKSILSRWFSRQADMRPEPAPITHMERLTLRPGDTLVVYPTKGMKPPRAAGIRSTRDWDHPRPPKG